jgi:hypothetical protein
VKIFDTGKCLDSKDGIWPNPDREVYNQYVIIENMGKAMAIAGDIEILD